MSLKNRFYIATSISLIVAVLSFTYNDAQSELPIFLNLLLGGVILYMLLFSLFQRGWLKTYWTNRVDKTIACVFIIALLIFGINMANKVDDQQESFWVVNGNIWLTDVLALLIWIFVSYLIFSWAFEQWKKVQTLKNDKGKAELALLKSQVNPHFFFNTLNNLYSLIKKDPDSAQEYVLKLADMMRFTIYDGKKESVTLEEELNYLNNFIELQTARYHTKVDIIFKQEVENFDRKISPMLFIFLVENAFKHGVEKLIKGAFIHIEFSESDTSMNFTIKNNFDPDNISKPHGIGLKNLKDRLELLYPKNHKLAIFNTDDVYIAKLELSAV